MSSFDTSKICNSFLKKVDRSYYALTRFVSSLINLISNGYEFRIPDVKPSIPENILPIRCLDIIQQIYANRNRHSVASRL